MSAVLLEEALTVRVWLSLVAPEVIPVRLTVWLSVPLPLGAATLISLIGSNVGGSLTALTVSVKKVLALVTPSLTVSLIATVPFWLGAGVMVTERLVPKPLTTMLLLATMV